MTSPSRWSFTLAAATMLSSGWCGAQAADQTEPGAVTEPAKEPRDRARDLYREGSRLYDQADYAGAIAAFEQAYATYPAAALLFNLAQAYRLLGPTQCEKALGYYQRYLETDESAADRAEVLVHLAEMRGCLKGSQSAAQSPPSAPNAPTTTQARPASPVTGVGVTAKQPERTVPTAAYVLGAAGVAGLATFGVLAILGKSQQAELERSCSPACSPEQLAPMETNFLVADIALLAGVVSLGTASYLWLAQPAGDPAALVARKRLGGLVRGVQLSVAGTF